MLNNATLLVARFIDDSMNENRGVPMALLVQTHNGLAVYYREFSGSRGRGSAWQLTNPSDLKAVEAVSYYEPIYVTMSKRDINMASVGNITATSTKAMNAWTDPSVPTFSSEEVSIHDWVQSFNVKAPISHVEEVVETSTIEIPVKEPIREMDGVSLASVPDVKWSNEYIQRKVHGNLSEFDIYDVALAKGKNVLISGPAGSGKTMSVIAYAANRGMRYYNVSSHNGVEPSQLFGKWNPNAQGSFSWQDGAVTDLVRHGGVLLINEVNFLPERVKTVLFSLLDKRREIQLMDKNGEVIKAHPDLLIIADMNPGYRGTKPLNEAEKDRYGHKLDFPYDGVIEAKLIKSKSLINVANDLRLQFDKKELITPVSTRSLVDFMDNATDLGLDYAMYSFVNGFSEVERNAVRLAVETVKANIAIDLGLVPAVTAIQPDEIGVN